MFIATALSLRGEDIFLSSSPQEAAHLIAKLQAGICRGQRTTGKGIRQGTAAVSAVAPEGESERGARPYRPAGTDYRFSAGLPEHRAAPRAGDRRQVPGGDQGGHQ